MHAEDAGVGAEGVVVELGLDGGVVPVEDLVGGVGHDGVVDVEADDEDAATVELLHEHARFDFILLESLVDVPLRDLLVPVAA